MNVNETLEELKRQYPGNSDIINKFIKSPLETQQLIAQKVRNAKLEIEAILLKPTQTNTQNANQTNNPNTPNPLNINNLLDPKLTKL
jgi:hypothetical protein